MNKKLTSCLIGLVFALSASVAQATLIIEGDFDADFGASSGVSNISGSFEAAFDDSLLVTGDEDFEDLAILTSFSLSPTPLGVTTFDTSNVGVDLYFTGGSLQDLVLGGLPDASAITANTDDFAVVYSGGTATLAAYTVATGDSGFTDSVVGSYIPEPSILALLATGLAGMGFARKKMKV